MAAHFDNGLESGALAEWLPLSKSAIVRFALAAVAVVDAVAFVIPRAMLVSELRHETAELENRKRAAQLVTDAGRVAVAHRREVQSRLDPRDLLPTISALARQEGTQIVTVKQSQIDKQGAARRVHLQARGPFGRIVSFIDAVAAAIPFGQVEDLTLRHVASSPEHDAGIELEYVLSVPDSQATGSDESAAR